MNNRRGDIRSLPVGSRRAAARRQALPAFQAGRENEPAQSSAVDSQETQGRRSYYFVAKRLLDLTLASVAFVVLSPLLIITALLIRWTSPGPAIYRQPRIGQDGRPFTMYKFRSMYNNQNDEPHRLAFERYRQGLPITEGRDADPFKLNGDPRVTSIGQFLRRTSLDELPQLWNIVRGDMSFVGPRPPIAYEVERYEARHLRRLAVPPGLTGLWQVQGRSRVTFEEMIDLDLEYIAKQSLLFDLKIMAATVPAVLSGKGAG